MTIYIAADHGGFALKQTLITYLTPTQTVVDCGNMVLDPDDDASDYANELVHRMHNDKDSLGIVICRSAGAVCIAANRFSHIRCTAGRTIEQVKADCNDDHINVLALAADHTPTEMAKALVEVFIDAPRGKDQRFVRRVYKLGQFGTHLT